MEKIKITCWNVNGIRSLYKSNNNTFSELFKEFNSEIICIQETKIIKNQVTPELAFPKTYKSFWSFSEIKKGYSGVATYIKENISVLESKENIESVEFEEYEGRSIMTDLGYFILYNLYFPNGGMSEERIKYKIKFNEKIIESIKENIKNQKKIIIVGDYNTAKGYLDFVGYTSEEVEERKSYTGFLNEEREFFNELEKLNLIDIFRKLNPNVRKATV
jgi:exodeoxyribonuclease III